MKVYIDKVLRVSEVNSKKWQGWAFRVLTGDEVVTIFTREFLELEGLFVNLYAVYNEKKKMIEYKFAGVCEKVEV